ALHGAVCSLLPSPGAFDHAIVSLFLNGKILFVDPTFQGQGGSLTTQVPVPYESGLIIDHGTVQLTGIERRGPLSSELFIREDFVIEGVESPMALKVRTEARGVAADVMRRQLGEAGKALVDKEFQEQYRSVFKGATHQEPVLWNDDPPENLLTVDEVFSIPASVQELEDSKEPVWFQFPAHVIRARMLGIPEENRKAPYALPFPDRVRQEIKVQVSWDFPFEPVEHTIENESFFVSVKGWKKNSAIFISYEFHHCKDRVEAGAADAYMEQLNEVNAHLGFYLPGPPKVSGMRKWFNKRLVSLSSAASALLFGFFVLPVALEVGSSGDDSEEFSSAGLASVLPDPASGE
ncbi:MAG: hypothetical protein AAF514_17715, partial [Verrucomicrobiota bacterium]